MRLVFKDWRRCFEDVIRSYFVHYFGHRDELGYDVEKVVEAETGEILQRDDPEHKVIITKACQRNMLNEIEKNIVFEQVSYTELVREVPDIEEYEEVKEGRQIDAFVGDVYSTKKQLLSLAVTRVIFETQAPLSFDCRLYFCYCRCTLWLEKQRDINRITVLGNLCVSKSKALLPVHLHISAMRMESLLLTLHAYCGGEYCKCKFCLQCSLKLVLVDRKVILNVIYNL